MNSFLRLLYRDLRAGLWSTKSIMAVQLVTPLLYIFVAGFVYSSIIDPETLAASGAISYYLFLAPGVVVMMIMFAASMAGAMLWLDKRLAMFSQIVAGPFSKWQYILSKLISIMLQGMLNALLVFLIASPLLTGLKISLEGMLYIAGSLLLGALFFGSLTLAISVVVKSNEAFNATLQVMFTPLMFLSSIYYPLEKAPLAIQVISWANPLTYAVDMLRAGLLQIYAPHLPIEIAALVVESLVAFAVATVAFSRVKP